MNKIKLLGFIVLTFIANYGNAQTVPFEISLEPIDIDNLGGIQSYAYGQANGKWLIIGGRLDGLHRRQPWAAFDIAGHNNQLVVIDATNKQKWSAHLTSLPTAIQEHLSTTNMQFYQKGNYLYILGGYGYSATARDHITFDKLTAVKVSDVINAVIQKSSFLSYFRQISDAQFQVTGGRLKQINQTYYLLGGQKFMGRYNPMGPNNGPGFTQEYTNAIRKFKIFDNGTTLTVNHLNPHIDAANLHRRDYNAEQQILTNGAEGITMFSGVFQTNVDLPFLNSVTIDSNTYTVDNSFQQYYNHYHCPVLPIYSEKTKEMHTVFFGGIAQFYDSMGTLVQDDNVPFVNTIARVTRDKNGKMAEFKLPVAMPSLLGAGAEFIPNLNFPHFENEVFKMDSISKDSTLIGYIFGGIASSAPNIFFINDGTQSSANQQIFKVYIKEASSVSTNQLNPASTSNLNLMIYPNPNDGVLNISFNLVKKENVTLSIYDLKGALLDRVKLPNLSQGVNHFQKKMDKFQNGNVYFISIETATQKATHKLKVSD